MNKIYAVLWATPSMKYPGPAGINVIVQGEGLTKTQAKKKAIKAVRSTGRGLFKGLRYRDTVDITDREILTVDLFGRDWKF